MSLVLLENPSEYVTLLRLNRPEALNALNCALKKKLADIFTELAEDSKVRVVVITGNEKSFAAGADIKEMYNVDMVLKKLHLLWKPIMEFPKPLIAAVNGYALGGGCELAMHSDIIIAGESAKFGQPEVKLGIIPGAGGTQRLTRTVGKFKAMKFLLTGNFISSKEAFEMGLVSEIVPDNMVLSQAIELAKKIAKKPPLAVMQIKEAVLYGQDIPIERALIIERKSFQLLFSSKDQKEGLSAFLEKRKPIFRGE